MPNEWPVHLAEHQQWIFASCARAPELSWEQLAVITVPVLPIHGTQDRNAPYGGGREWATRLPHGELLTIPGAAHMAWLDAPDVVYPAREHFLTGEWPSGADPATRNQPTKDKT
jgi:pimeloyl-ACP methyl ester carboxylesterase